MRGIARVIAGLAFVQAVCSVQAAPLLPASATPNGVPAQTQLQTGIPLITNLPPGSQGQGKAPPSLPSNPLPPPLGESDFQRLIFESTGKKLPMFGYSMFANVPSTFAPVQDIPVTPDYRVGPGDEVVIRAWGQVDVDLKEKVDRMGSIYIPNVGSVNVAGSRYQDLKTVIRDAIGRNYRNFDLQVNLGQLRSIHVYVVGQARRPGSYTVSSLSTLINALFASGGPSAAGSMRHIQLKRDDRVISDFDVYDFLLNGDKSKDVQLLDGDVIYIPPIGSVAAITGSVRVPAIYELKDDVDLDTLIRMAGGLSTTAGSQKVEVERIENHKDRVVADFDLDKTGMKRGILDGDVVKVFPISLRMENAVTLRGNVIYPFSDNWKKGMRISDLIPDRDMLVTREYWLKRYNVNPKNLASLKEENGINWDYAAIQRYDWKTLKTNLIPFNLGKAVLEHDPSQNLELEPGDIVTVFSMSDVNVPQEKQRRLVTIQGEVANAGVYQAKPGETLRQLVERIGGFAPDAYLFGAVFTRESTRKLQQQRLDESINRMEMDLQKSSGTMLQGAKDTQSLDAASKQIQSEKVTLEKMRALKPTGRIVLEVPPGSNSLKDLPDIALEDGDSLYIPAVPSTVGVFGDVYNENNAFFYRSEKKVSDYLDQAGGATREADTGRMFVLRADGSVISSQTSRGIFSSSFDRMSLMPGDAVVVPEKMDKTPIIKNVLDWAQVFMNMGVSIAALRMIGII